MTWCKTSTGLWPVTKICIQPLSLCLRRTSRRRKTWSGYFQLLEVTTRACREHGRIRYMAVSRCNFADADLEIKLQIIPGCRTNAFRKACLWDKLALYKILETFEAWRRRNGRQNTSSRVDARQQTPLRIQKQEEPTGRHGNKKKCRDCRGK